MPISDCWPALDASLDLLDPPTHKRITSLHQHLLPRIQQIEDYATSLHPRKASCRMVTSTWTWGQSFLVYELVFAGSDGEDLGESWVARFGLPPYEGDEFFNTPEQLERKILNEVGALRIVKERTTVPVPDVFGFAARHGDGFQRTFGVPPPETGSTRRHALGEEFPAFILMSAMRGKTIEDCGIPTHELGGHWDTPTSDPSYQEYLDSDVLKRYLSCLADIHVQLSRITFPQIGSFTIDDATGEVRIGPMAEFGLGPFDTAEEYYAVLSEAFKRIAEGAVVDDDEEEEEDHPVPINESITLPLSEIKRLRRVFAASLFPDALKPHLSASNNHGPFPVRHGDLHSENILVDETTGEIIGVIDWEGAGTVPWEVAGALNWEVQGEVLETKNIPGLGLVRPEIHAAFNKALKDTEEEMEARAANITRRRQLRSTNASLRLSLAESRGSERRGSTVSSLSEYATPNTSPSPSSSYASLVSVASANPESTNPRAGHSPSSSPSSSNASFTSFGNSTADDLNSTIGSQSNLTLTSPLTSPATSIFDINRDSTDPAKKGPDSPVSTPKADRRSGVESGAGKLMSWLGLNRAASEGGPRSPPSAFNFQNHPPQATLPRAFNRLPDIQLPTTPVPPALSTPVLEAIREPLPPSPSKVIKTRKRKGEEEQKPEKPQHDEGLSLSLAAMTITESTSPRATKSLIHSPSPSPRPHSSHARYSSMSMHRRQRSSMVLSIPNTNLGTAINGESLSRSAGVSPSHSPLLGPGPMHRSRTPSPSPASSPNPRARPYNHNTHTRRPSSFYMPVPLNVRSLSAGSASASTSPSTGSYFPPHVRAGGLFDLAPAAVLTAELAAEKDLAQSVGRKGSPDTVFGGGALSSTPTVLTPVATPLETKTLTDQVPEVEAIRTRSVSRRGVDLSIGAVSAPSGQTLSDLHAHPGSYIAGYLGHWMFVLGCEWDTVGMALWDVVKAQKTVEAATESKEGVKGEAVEEPHLEKAFLDWVVNVWSVEQSKQDAGEA